MMTDQEKLAWLEAKLDNRLDELRKINMVYKASYNFEPTIALKDEITWVVNTLLYIRMSKDAAIAERTDYINQRLSE